MKLYKDIRFIIFIFLSFIFSQIIWSLINIPYSNPYQIIGNLSLLQFNPLNNFIRFIETIVVTLCLPFLLEYFFSHHQKIFRIIFCLLLSALVVLNSNIDLISKQMGTIDMFHIGEQLGPASGFLLGKKLYSGIYFAHGALQDVLIGVLSIKLFGYSISGFLTFSVVLSLLSVIIFFILLQLIFPNVFFYPAAIFFFMSKRVQIDAYKDLVTWAILILLYLVINSKKLRFIPYLVISFISFFTFFYYIDRGFYLTALSLTFGVIMSYVLKNIKVLYSILAGIILSAISIFLLVGRVSFIKFIKMSFVEIPQIQSYLAEYVFPRFQTDNLFLYWLPILLIIANSFILIYFFFNKYKKNYTLVLYAFFVNLLSLFYFRQGIGRSDDPHIVLGSTPIFLTSFLLIYIGFKQQFYHIKILTYEWWRNTTLFVAYFLFFFIPQVNLGYQKSFIKPLTYPKTKIAVFITLSKIQDEQWLNNEQKNVVAFIKTNASNKDYIFVFPSEPLYYYLFNRKNPTRFYATWFAQPSFYQKEMLADLKIYKPKYIIYEDSTIWNAPDFINTKTRFPIINNWILKNYTLDRKIGSAVIMK